MSLPEIPDEAVDAVLIMDGAPLDEPHEREWPTAALAAAWPHLYAAALRHAAERLLDEQERWGADPADALLNRFADEATR